MTLSRAEHAIKRMRKAQDEYESAQAEYYRISAELTENYAAQAENRGTPQPTRELVINQQVKSDTRLKTTVAASQWWANVATMYANIAQAEMEYEQTHAGVQYANPSRTQRVVH